MKAGRLLTLYENIADTPDPIQRLRRFVLDLAMRGKLVPQDPNEEPSPELLQRIAAERLDQAGLPQGWRRAKIGTVLTLQYGKGLKATERSEGGPVPVFGSNGIIGFTHEPLTVRPSIIIGRKGSAGALNLCNGPSWTTDVAYYVEAPSFLALRFLFYALASLNLEMLGKGVKPGLSRSEVYDQIIVIPPIAEQRRIVSKIDELMALIDRLEAARTKREATRDKLTATSLSRLSAPNSTTFRDDARFFLSNLPALTTRADQVKKLRQTILNLAIRGKLVPQNPNDHPAPEFDKNVPESLERPFQVPPNWRWSRLAELGTLKGGGTPSKGREDFWNGDIPWVSPKDMKTDYLYSTQMKITTAAVADSAVKLIEPNSLLFVVRGMILAHSFPVAISRVTLTINQDMKALVLKEPRMAEYLLRALKGLKAEILAQVRRSSHGTCRLDSSDYSNLLIPIPPMAEQCRIVDKVDELMTICDQLEARLATVHDIRRRLLEALLVEALEPEKIARELEAAE